MKSEHIFELELDEYVSQLMDRAKVPAVALAVVIGQEIVYKQGFGKTTVDEDGTEVTPHTLFRFGSISKPVLGTAIATLVEKGQIDLQRPVTEYLPWVQFREEKANRQINLFHLLSHTSGLPTEYSPEGSQDEKSLEDSLRNEIPSYEFVAPPSHFWSYSNAGIRLAAHVAEKVTGKYFAQLIDELVFQPLKMCRSTFSPLIALTYPTAMPSELGKEGKLQTLRRFTNNAARWPAGGLISSVVDLAQFVKLHLNKGAIDGIQLIKPETIELLHKPAIKRNTQSNDGYGLTFETTSYKGFQRVGHSGRHDTYGSRLYMLPEIETGLVIVCNRLCAFEEEIEAIANKIFDLVLRDWPPRENKPTVPVSVGDEKLADFFGNYVGPYKGLAQLLRGPSFTLNGVTYDISEFSPQNDCYVGKSKTGALLSISPQAKGDKLYLLVDGQPCAKLASLSNTNAAELDMGLIGNYEGKAGRVEIIQKEGKLFYTKANKVSTLVPAGKDRYGCDFGLIELDRDSNRDVRGFTIGLTFYYRKV